MTAPVEPLAAEPLELPKRRLRQRLVVSYLTLSLVTVALLAALAFLRSRAALRNSMFDRLSAVAEVETETLNRWVSEQEDAILFLAQLPQLAASLELLESAASESERRREATRRLHSLLDAAQAHADLSEIMLFAPVGGEVLVATDPSQVGEYYLNALFYVQGRQQTFIQNVYASPITSKPTLTIATPVRASDGRTVGVVAGHVNLARIDRMLDERTGLGRTGEAYLVSAFNDFVSSERFGRDEHGRGVHSKGVNAAVAGDTGVGLYQNYRGVPVIGAYRWIAERELALVVEMEQSEAFAPASNLVWTIVTAGLLSVLVLTSGVRIIARQIADPVAELSDAARRVAEGDFTVVADVSTDDEIGVLATAFNRMTAKLRLLYADLHEQINTTKRTLESLERARDEAESATRAKSEFVARMSHEIRTPLHAVLGMVHLMQRTPLDETQADYAGKIRSSARHLLTLISSVLDFSKLEAERVELEQTRLDLDEVLENLTALVPSAREGVEVVFQIRPDVPRHVTGDALRLGQVLSNLLSNAIKFTHEGEIHLLVEHVETTETERALRFSLRDTGIGIDPEHASDLFEEFSQEDESTTREYGGTGLGLSISRQLVELMGGSMEVQGEPGRGSTFSFTARFGVDDEPGAGDAGETERRLGGLRARVDVEHDTSSRALAELLESMGVAVEHARDTPPERSEADVLIADWRPSCDTRWPTVFLASPHEIVAATSGPGAPVRSKCTIKPVTRPSVVECLMQVLSSQPETARARRTETSKSLSGVSVLVVEDNPINQEIVAALLSEAGARVTMASNGKQALEKSESDDYDVMLLDIQMPGMSGIEVAKTLRSRDPHSRLAILVLTADPLMDAGELEAFRISSYLTKPIEPDRLLAAIENAAPALDNGSTELDVAAGVARAAGNESLYHKLLADFVERESEPAFEDVERSLRAGDEESARARLHNVKGVASNLGAARVAELAAHMEEVVASGGSAADDLGELREAFRRLRAEVEKLRGPVTDDPAAQAAKLQEAIP